MAGNRWAKGPEDFAVRIEVGDIKGFFRKELIVEPGTRAILLIDGRNEAGQLGPGRYTMDDLFRRLAGLGTARKVTAILVDAGDVDLDFTIPDLFTSDPIRVKMDCHLSVRLENPLLFLVNAMRGQRSFSRYQLREYLFGEIQNAASDALSRHSVRDLGTDLALKEEIATAIEAHLNDTFRRLGLRFLDVRALNFRHERWDEIRRIREGYFLQISKEEAELEGKKRLLDVLSEKELQELAEEEARIANYERRVQLYKRMRQAVLQDKLSALRTEEELERYLHGLDKRKLLREAELEEFKREMAWRREGWEALKRHLLTRLDVIFEEDLKTYQAVKELERQKMREEFERAEEEKDLELGLKALERLKEIKRRDELERKRAEHQMELERMEKMTQFSVEALIAATGPEQARLLAELKRTEILSGLSEEQILALAAEKSPEVAKAFQEKFRSLSAGELRGLYEKLLDARRVSDERAGEILWEVLDKVVEALGRKGGSGPTVVVTGQGGPTVIPGSGIPAGEVQICRRCHAKSPVGTRYCPNCGESFY
jgi:hypothetical protein